MSSAVCLQKTAALVFCYSCFSLFVRKRLSTALVFCYSFAKDFSPRYPVSICKGLLPCSAFCLQRTVFCYSFAKDCGPCLLLFVCKRLRPLSSAILVFRCLFAKDWATPSFSTIHLQRTSILVIRFRFAKDCCLVPLFVYKGLFSAIHLQKTAVLVFCCLFAKDCGPCLLLFVCKRLLPLSSAILVFRCLFAKDWAPPSFSAIHLQRTAVHVFWFSFAKDCCPCFRFLFAKNCSPCFLLYVLQKTAVLEFCYSFAKDCGPCLLLLYCKDLWSLFPFAKD